MRHATALPLLLTLLALPCHAAIYKWVDEKGVTHYTEQPPASGKGQEIQPRTTPAIPAPTRPPNPRQTSPPPARARLRHVR